MMFETELYTTSVARLPVDGQRIIGYQNEKSIVVYQAYKKNIADFAVKNQQLGGPEFSFNRMSWIKPNFLWMMFRCGWASKENQDAVLAFQIRKTFFLEIMQAAVNSTFKDGQFKDHDDWKDQLASSDVRLQWDPDHDPFGGKLTRRAIQLGLRGKYLERFATTEVEAIEDITPFVKAQWELVNQKQLDKLVIPLETIFEPTDRSLNKKLGMP